MPDATEEQDDKPRTIQIRLSSIMFTYIREFVFLFALVFTSYAAFFTNVPKIGKPPPATPFFPSTSIVTDLYRGNLGMAFHSAEKFDVVVVMFYAPWDAESQNARLMFDKVARLLSNEIRFAAVNCWSPGSECRHHYPKIRSFPVIFIYPQVGTGIRYKGPLETDYLVRFLRAYLRPLHRVTCMENVTKLFASHNAVVVGSFLFEGNVGASGFYTFYTSAVKSLEMHSGEDVAFAITTDEEAATRLNITHFPSIWLFSWNGREEYSREAAYNDETVTNWVWQHTTSSALWISPPGKKSATIFPAVESTPALIVFAPRNPLAPVDPVFNLVKDIALRYYNCKLFTRNDSWTNEIIKVLDESQRALRENFRLSEEICSKTRLAQRMDHFLTSTVVAASALSNRSRCLTCDKMGPDLEVCIKPTEASTVDYGNLNHQSSIWVSDHDEYGPSELLKKHRQDECRLFDQMQTDNMWFPQLTDGSADGVHGLSCSNNRTLSIVMMDSTLHYQFAEGLGVPILNFDKPVAVVVDSKAESQYFLREPVSQLSLVNFIVNHTEGILERHLRSTAATQSSSLILNRYSVKSDKICGHNATDSCIIELNSGSFLKTVMNPTQAVIVLYHSPMCALCRSVAHVFLLISRYFRHFPSLRFARIDGENNDLPWRYTMDSYPTVLFFPISRKEETRVYQQNLPFTVKNLMHFVLANLDSEAKVPAMISLCMSFEAQQTIEESRNCTAKVRNQVHEGLNRSLRQMRSVIARWKDTEPSSAVASALLTRKRKLFLSLQYFRECGFILGSIDRSSLGAEEILELYLKFLRTA